MERIKLVFATHNRHKFEEISALMPAGIELVPYWTLSEKEIPETGDTLSQNAYQKSSYVLQNYGLDCFADDTGLEVEALGGAPGVYSARYAGEHASYQDNVLKLLAAMAGKENRRARFATVISLLLDGKEYFFNGYVDGMITRGQRGVEGFGYDPVFLVPEKGRTFGQLTAEEKGAISHRGKALRAFSEKLATYLKK